MAAEEHTSTIPLDNMDTHSRDERKEASPIKRVDTFGATMRINEPFICANEKADALAQIAIIGMLTFGFGVTALLNLKPGDISDFDETLIKPFVILMGISVCSSGIGMVVDSMMYYVLKQMHAHNQPKAIARLVSDPIIWQINNIGQYLIWTGILSFCAATGVYFFALLDEVAAFILLVIYSIIILFGASGTVYIFAKYLAWTNWDVEDPLGAGKVPI
eukprot:UN10651